MNTYQRFEVITSDSKLTTMVDVPIGADVLEYANESLRWWNSANGQNIVVTGIVYLSTITR